MFHQLRHSIQILSVLALAAATGRADTLISMPPPVQAEGSSLVVLDMFSSARLAVSSMAGGAEALERYAMKRQAPYHVYSVSPRRYRAGGMGYDPYAVDPWYFNGPRIWGTWWPWGWGCVNWTIGWPSCNSSLVVGSSGMTFAVLGGN